MRDTTIFEWAEDKEYGGEGWIPQGYPDFNAVDVNFLAHDVIEHFPKHKGTLADEMMAFGSMVYIRALPGWFEMKNERSWARRLPEEQIGMELGTFLHKERDGANYKLPEPTNVPELRDDEDAKHMIEAACKYAFVAANRERDNFIYGHKGKKFTRSKMVKNMEGWMKKGYLACQKRWKGASSWQLMNVYEEITEKCKRRKTGEHGDLLHIQVNPNTLEVKVWVKYAYELYRED